VQIPCGRGSVFLWRRCDTLCTSSFMYDVTFGGNGRLNVEATTTSVLALPTLWYRGGVWCLWMSFCS